MPTGTDGSLSRTAHNSYYPLKRRKRRRKSSTSSGKWPSNTTDSESRPLDDNRTMSYENKDDDTTDQADDAGKVNSKIFYFLTNLSCIKLKIKCKINIFNKVCKFS